MCTTAAALLVSNVDVIKQSIPLSPHIIEVPVMSVTRSKIKFL